MYILKLSICGYYPKIRNDVWEHPFLFASANMVMCARAGWSKDFCGAYVLAVVLTISCLVAVELTINAEELTMENEAVAIENEGDEIGTQAISYHQADNGELRLYRKREQYVGNINSELKKTQLVTGPNGNYVSGESVVVEWVNGLSTVPSKKPVMYFESADKIVRYKTDPNTGELRIFGVNK